MRAVVAVRGHVEAGVAAAAVGGRAGDAVAGPDEDPMQPHVELARVLEATDVPPRGHECVPGRVPGEVRVEQDQARRPVESLEGALDQDREGVMVARPCPRHEIRFDAPHQARTLPGRRLGRSPR